MTELKPGTPDWPCVNAKLIAEECGERHIQSVIEYAQRDIALLTARNAALFALVDDLADVVHAMLIEDEEGFITADLIAEARATLTRAKETIDG